MLRNLRDRPELNGRVGHLRGVCKNGRWAVQLDADVQVAVQPHNVKLLVNSALKMPKTTRG